MGAGPDERPPLRAGPDRRGGSPTIRFRFEFCSLPLRRLALRSPPRAPRGRRPPSRPCLLAASHDLRPASTPLRTATYSARTVRCSLTGAPLPMQRFHNCSACWRTTGPGPQQRKRSQESEEPGTGRRNFSWPGRPFPGSTRNSRPGPTGRSVANPAPPWKHLDERSRGGASHALRCRCSPTWARTPPSTRTGSGP